MFPYDLVMERLDGTKEELSAYRGKVLLVVNVASRCGLTPQYEGLVELYHARRDDGFVVLGFPCNQFLGQEPGTAEEIETFCRTTYGVDFPMFAKIEVNGEGRHRLYASLCEVPDGDGVAGDVQWNFEKFLVSRDGERIERFRPTVEPQDPMLVGAIDALL
ncbi:Glutathione peroxidase [Acidimicrobium ferrooxidans DSM 10331]|uniref:Glutathione peroxidase n=1 Tax=Acidimicrobium ferrooxidans (strain DSM 10331 / JCM 15462 / NBRC 103882 / ICP) TaxID=525909 RepID=C7LZH5_ACIFD|nr:glutathione peroxidase [Acidimicrobium ferrooxidans]ACU54133.1 Glutathione peroxidase [Acidimicrobium ferrooxidans DSM 10331]